MRDSLAEWLADANTLGNARAFGLPELVRLGDVRERQDDLFRSLLGELFANLREPPDDRRDWAAIGNGFVQLWEQAGRPDGSREMFYSAAAFYSGGYSASAYLAARQIGEFLWGTADHQACVDLMSRPNRVSSEIVDALVRAVGSGDTQSIAASSRDAGARAVESLGDGPQVWIGARVLSGLVEQFARTNLRSVLPDGQASRWDPLIQSFLTRPIPVWDFFPSQIAAIDAGVLGSDRCFSLQMPTGAGKTALTETVIFDHLTKKPLGLAILLVPHRALARELRRSVAVRLRQMGLSVRTVYGGTVPSQDEVEESGEAGVIIGTPEAVTGLISRTPGIATRASLVVCDEGHLLDSPGRGIGLELLLTRLRSAEPSPRMLFLSAIVPNIEEINDWLGGSSETVVRSDFRPAEAEFAVLDTEGDGKKRVVDLRFARSSTTPREHRLPGLLGAGDFQYVKQSTGRTNTYDYGSFKTRAVAAARKALGLGTVAIFAANKSGNQGVVGLAEELLAQLESGLPLPAPPASESPERVDLAAAYLSEEYGADWIGAAVLRVGATIHHGDIPQETREVLEELLVDRELRLVICTSTLAEGVNLPIRTLVIYSAQRSNAAGT